jgi:hypothetical protein
MNCFQSIIALQSQISFLGAKLLSTDKKYLRVMTLIASKKDHVPISFFM